MDRSDLAADYLLAARRCRRLILSIPAEAAPHSPDEAYRVQDKLVAKLSEQSGGRLVGYKVAATNPTAQRLLKVDSPFYGQLLSTLGFSSPASLPSGDFTLRCIEAEFCVEMGEDLSPGDAPYTVQSVAGSVVAIIPAIEVVDHRFVDWAEVGALGLIADNAIHGTWVEGRRFRDWRQIELAEHPVTLSVNGHQVSDGSGAAVLGHPLNVVAWLANELPRHGRHLKRGDKVMTGTAAPVYFANPGDQITCDFGSLGRVEVDWTA